MIIYWETDPVLGKLVTWSKLYLLKKLKKQIELKHGNVHQNTTNEASFYLIRNDVHI